VARRVIASRSHYLFDHCEIFVAGDMGLPYPTTSRHAWNLWRSTLSQWQGVGSALIEAVTASSRVGFEAIRLSTTNDNVDALRFYQRRGFRLTALRPGAVDESRRLKPTISMNGQHGIPIHDELDLVRPLR
jgi:ribosomal protein S18 acetylase RimI-like enzyme